jgi:hypothetical protein
LPASYLPEDGGVCSPSGPPVPAIDAGVGIEEAGGGQTGEAGLDGGPGTPDGSSDASRDAALDGAADAGAADAPTGG